MPYLPDIGPCGRLSGDQGRSPRMEGDWDLKAGWIGGRLVRSPNYLGEARAKHLVLVLQAPCPGPPASVWSFPSSLDKPDQGFSKRRPFPSCLLQHLLTLGSFLATAPA